MVHPNNTWIFVIIAYIIFISTIGIDNIITNFDSIKLVNSIKYGKYIIMAILLVIFVKPLLQ